jgi:predicted DNA-binding transcriptional regulator YafY
VLGLAAAAKACGVSVSTLRRRREDLEELGAVATPSGWRIPIAALVGSGLMPPTTKPPAHDGPVQPLVGGSDAPSDTLREELETLRSRLAAAEQRAAVAEAIAAERERLIQTQAAALRMLEAPTSPTGSSPPTSTQGTPPEAPPPAIKKSAWRFWRV